MSNLNGFFEPRSVVVVGGSDTKGSVGYGVMKNITDCGFKGKVIPVNIKRKKVWGKRAYKSVLDVKERVDLAVIATPSVTVPGILKECGKKSVKNVIVMSAGFGEVGKEGKKLSEDLLKLAEKFGIRVIGPNCMGIIRPKNKMNLTFAHEMPREGNIAFISQSGALGSAALDWAKDHKFGFSFFASLGAMVDVDFGDLIEILEKDKETKGVLLYIESLHDAQQFLRAASSCTKVKPIIALKVGKSEQGAKAAMSHTGSLAGNDAVFDAAFRRAGVVRVNEVDELFDCAKTMSMQPLPRGKSLAIVTNAGGPGVISADVLVSMGGDLAKLSKDSVGKLNKILSENWSKNNPVDVLGDAGAEEYKKAVEVCLKDKNVDGVLAILTPQSMTDSFAVAKGIASVKTNNKTLMAAWMGGYSVEKGFDLLEEMGVPSFLYPERAVKAFMFLNERKRVVPFSLKRVERKKAAEEIILNAKGVLTELEAKEVLKAYGIPVLDYCLVEDEKEAVRMAKKIGFPVAMKVSSREIIHKTDVGGVVLNVNGEKEVEENYGRMIKKGDGVFIEKMASRKHELIIGSKKDEIFGPTVVFGAGGTAVNVFKDFAIGLPPLNEKFANELMKETKVYDLLKGFRGEKGVDLKKLNLILQRFSELVVAFPEIKEIDINPFAIDSSGGVVLDAKILLSPR